jgi:hypothetical protein
MIGQDEARARAVRKQAEAKLDVAMAQLCALAVQWSEAVNRGVASVTLRSRVLSACDAYARAAKALGDLPLMPASHSDGVAPPGVDDATGATPLDEQGREIAACPDCDEVVRLRKDGLGRRFIGEHGVKGGSFLGLASCNGSGKRVFV